MCVCVLGVRGRVKDKHENGTVANVSISLKMYNASRCVKRAIRLRYAELRSACASAQCLPFEPSNYAEESSMIKWNALVLQYSSALADLRVCFIFLRGGNISFNIRPRGYKTFFMLNSIEHEIFPAHKC